MLFVEVEFVSRDVFVAASIAMVYTSRPLLSQGHGDW